MRGPCGSPELFVPYRYHLGDEVGNDERQVQKNKQGTEPEVIHSTQRRNLTILISHINLKVIVPFQ